MNEYVVNGYKSRKDYLRSLAEEFCVPFETVVAMAVVLGPGEDFDGLVTMLEDFEEVI